VYRVGWFSTGRDQAARDLLTSVWFAAGRGELAVEIPFVFSNRGLGEAVQSDLFLELVQAYGIPLVCFSSRDFRPELRCQDLKAWRLQYDREVMRLLGGFYADLYTLAGYMLIVGEEMCRCYNMINLHPAPPNGPAGTWQEVIWKLIEAGAEWSGVMMHRVTPELDKGPPVTYCRFPIRGYHFDELWAQIEGLPLAEVKARQGEDSPLFRMIRKHGVLRELPLLVVTLKAFSEGRVRVEGGQVVDGMGQPIPGYDITPEIEEIIRTRIPPSELHLF
jgi:folate-dependent phosphoribosylglycinamide formyltransferase PurN